MPGFPDIELYTAHPGSRLGRLLDDENAAAPYWAYPWAGGMALVQHFHQHPASVKGLRVLDLGAGSGLVGIAALRAGALSVTAAEIDANGRAAIGLNATLNAVMLALADGDVTAGPPLLVDLVTVGDLFYDPDLAPRVTVFLDRCLASGQKVLVGDVGRAHLPLSRLTPLAHYPVADFGDGAGGPGRDGTVFAFT